MRLLRLYNTVLEKYPKSGTSVTTGFCYGAGDFLAQKIEKDQCKREKYDIHRLIVFTAFGTFFGGPIYYAWFQKLSRTPQVLEKIVQYNEKRFLAYKFREQLNIALKNNNIESMSFKTFRETFKQNFENIDKPLVRSKTVLTAKILLDQFIFSVFYPMFFLIMSGVMLKTTKPLYDSMLIEDKEESKKKLAECNTGLLKKSFLEGVHDIKTKFGKIYMLDCAIWPMAQMINFSFVPQHLQPVYVNVLNIGWNSFLCYTQQESH
jgi:hypothetical protein